MANNGHRVKRVYQGLSARERALMVYAEMCADRAEDPAILNTMPAAQGREYNFYVRLINAIFHVLGPLASDFQRQAENMNLRMLIYRTHVRWSIDRLLLLRERPDLATLDEEDVDVSGPSTPWNLIRSMRGKPDPVTGAVAEETKRDRFVIEMYEQMLNEIPMIWSELAAFEKVAAEAVAELDTVDIPPMMKDLIDETRSTVSSLASLINLTEPEAIELADEIDDERIEMLRQVLRNARQPSA